MFKNNGDQTAPKQKAAKVLSTYELMQLFPNAEAAYEYLKGILWPNGPVCPFCGSTKHYVKTDGIYHRCAECRESYTIRTGTIFQRSHIPLQKSAWFMEQRIRAACCNQAEKILSGIVEVDETYLGGKEKNKHDNKMLNAGRGTVGKTSVMGMRDRDGTVVAQVIGNTDKDTLQEIISDTVAEGSTVCTDEHAAYNGLGDDFDHKTVNHSAKQYVDGMAHTNGIESV